jgi:hypothetical protein
MGACDAPAAAIFGLAVPHPDSRTRRLPRGGAILRSSVRPASRRPGPRTLDPAFFLKAWAAGRSAGRWARCLPATRVRSPRRQAPLPAPLSGRLRKRPSTEQGRGDYAGGREEGDEYLRGRGGARLLCDGDGDRGAALDAFDRYGKGCGHPAQLNMGDCFGYAAARVMTRATLLQRGMISRRRSWGGAKNASGRARR